jgi:uncharacterized protein with HEPN domain
MPQRDDATLYDTLTAARLIRLFCADMTPTGFLSDLKTQSAVLHQILIIGEATKRLSPETRQTHHEIPWRLMAGMRDRLIHGYDDVDMDQVWQTVQKDIQQLINWLDAIDPGNR